MDNKFLYNNYNSYEPYIQENYYRKNFHYQLIKKLNKSSSLGNYRFKRKFEYYLYNKPPLTHHLSLIDKELLPFQRDNEDTLKAFNNYIKNKEKLVETNSKNYLLYLTKYFNNNRNNFPFQNYNISKDNLNYNFHRIKEFVPNFLKSKHTNINGQKYFEHNISSKGILIGETPKNSITYKNYMDNTKKNYLKYNENIAFNKKKFLFKF